MSDFQQYPYGYMNTPGAYDSETFIDKQITYTADGAKHKFPISLAPLTGDLDAGVVLGLTTADGLYRPVRRTTLTAQAAVPAAGSAQTLKVQDITPFKVGDSLTVMANDGTQKQTVGAITAIDSTTNTITVTTALTTAVASGGFVFVGDGSEVALVILAQPIPDGPASKTATVFVGGVFFTDQLIGLDDLAKKDLMVRQPLPNMTIIPV
ncbi:hypothetical protein PP175_05595 [Aneurinibacillus sp. Ricciae_BoGa-3]|uniref:hypothetical protein n=1 Tax=Aneurinibacillus sp. Ricciae_BoGa-3 TaxID=3022697 RepID=UPI002340BE9F|nr:hypothetical protein [Aneurinibacillus sp. Ricciae_BoGa-3]WCK55424.1 hypothetical protein PP175_05595 [Aneurinibacillus sp. Ricciae_BoGa-3]